MTAGAEATRAVVAATWAQAAGFEAMTAGADTIVAAAAAMFAAATGLLATKLGRPRQPPGDLDRLSGIIRGELADCGGNYVGHGLLDLLLESVESAACCAKAETLERPRAAAARAETNRVRTIW